MSRIKEQLLTPTFFGELTQDQLNGIAQIITDIEGIAARDQITFAEAIDKLTYKLEGHLVMCIRLYLAREKYLFSIPTPKVKGV